MKRVGVLIGGTVLFWLVSVGVAGWWVAHPAILFSGVALALSLFPALASLVWSMLATRQSAEQQLLSMVGGMLLRMALALGIGSLLYFRTKLFHHSAFWVWVLLFYLFTLTLETILVVSLREHLAANEADKLP
ncbi:MAG: hypothetical protein KatS3mg105_4871 [Gemmatales bacterium]|nr:MAG: hypothetical protein KatS3mg105_4871 [Gemmatales bacterium]